MISCSGALQPFSVQFPPRGPWRVGPEPLHGTVWAPGRPRGTPTALLPLLLPLLILLLILLLLLLLLLLPPLRLRRQTTAGLVDREALSLHPLFFLGRLRRLRRAYAAC